MAAEKYLEIQRQYKLYGGKKPLKRLCEEHDVKYWSFMRWRRKNGHSIPQNPRRPTGFLEVRAIGIGVAPSAAKREITRVSLRFGNGLSFERKGMDIDSLISFLKRIKPLLCLS